MARLATRDLERIAAIEREPATYVEEGPCAPKTVSESEGFQPNPFTPPQKRLPSRLVPGLRRRVEVHVTALLAKADVESRSALVAKVWEG